MGNIFKTKLFIFFWCTLHTLQLQLLLIISWILSLRINSKTLTPFHPKKTLTTCYIYPTNIIYITTYFTTYWNNKLWIADNYFHTDSLIIPYIFYFFHHSKPSPSRSCRKRVIRLTVFHIYKYKNMLCLHSLCLR